MTTPAKDSWTVETERMRITLVSERMPLPPMPKGAPASAYGGWTPETMPVIPKYALITRPGREAEPIRVEGDDVALLMWVLSKLPRMATRFGHVHHPAGVPMFPGDGGDFGGIG